MIGRGAEHGPCAPGDGIVPANTQEMTGNGALRFQIDAGPGHTEEPRSPEVHDRVSQFLRENMRIALCGEGPVQRGELARDSVYLAVGDVVSWRATPVDACDRETSLPAVVSASSTNSSVVTATPVGRSVRLTAQAPGTAQIVTSVGPTTFTEVVSVLAPDRILGTLYGPTAPCCARNEFVQFRVDIRLTGTRPVEVIDWLVNGVSTGHVGFYYAHLFTDDATVSAVVRNGSGATTQVGAWPLTWNGDGIQPFRTRAPTRVPRRP